MERMEPFKDYKENLITLTQTFADLIIARCMPQAEEISENQARMLYGDRWLRKQIKYGLVKPVKKGFVNCVRRSDLDRLRKLERTPAEIIFKPRNHNNGKL